MNFVRIITSKIGRRKSENHLLMFRRGRNIGSLGSGMLARMTVSVVEMFTQFSLITCWQAELLWGACQLQSGVGSWLESFTPGTDLEYRYTPGHRTLTDCTVTTITVHLYCTLVTAYKLPALTTESRSCSLSVWTLSYTQYILILDPVLSSELCFQYSYETTAFIFMVSIYTCFLKPQLFVS